MKRKAKVVDGAFVHFPVGTEVTVLCIDEEDPAISRKACWVRHWPEDQDYPRYASCDVTDLEFVE